MLAFGTNIELMVQVAFVAVVAAIAIPFLVDATDKDAECAQVLLEAAHAKPDAPLPECPKADAPLVRSEGEASTSLACPEPARHVLEPPRLERAGAGPWRAVPSLPDPPRGWSADAPFELNDGMLLVTTRVGRLDGAMALEQRASETTLRVVAPALFAVACLLVLGGGLLHYQQRRRAEREASAPDGGACAAWVVACLFAAFLTYQGADCWSAQRIVTSPGQVEVHTRPFGRERPPLVLKDVVALVPLGRRGTLTAYQRTREGLVAHELLDLADALHQLGALGPFLEAVLPAKAPAPTPPAGD